MQNEIKLRISAAKDILHWENEVKITIYKIKFSPIHKLFSISSILRIENEEYRMRTNKEAYQIYQSFISGKRLE